MKKSSKKSVLFFAGIFVLMSCLILASALDVGGIRAKAAEILYAAGDINGDGEVNGKDLTRLSKYIAGLNPEVLSELDTNKDGSINGKDITHLMRYIAGEIPDLSGNVYHSVIYFDELTGYTNEGYYSEATGLYTLPKLTAEGRTFDGWYTDPDGKGKKVVFIPKGSTENLILYANWKLIEYKITYIDAPQHFNVETYTIENEVVFSAAQWNGLRFSHWTDADGKEITCIPKGTTGDVTVTANWLYMENTAIPSKEVRELWLDYDEKTGHQIFVYELGEIEHVVLKELDRKYKKANESASWSEEVTVTLDEGTAEEVTKTTSNSVSKSKEYSVAVGRARDQSNSYTEGFSIGVEISPIKDILTFNGGGNFEWTEINSESWSNTITDSEGKIVSSENTVGNSSTVTFNNTISRTFNTSTTVGENMPEGTYRYVYYGTVRVFAVVTYEPASGNYRTDTFSILGEEIGSMTLYEPPRDAEINIKSRDVLPYDIPFGENEDGTLKEIDEYMSNAYFVNYDANGGTGSMYISAHINGQEHKLSENSFVKPGYTWNGWIVEGKGTAIGKDEVVSNLAANGEMLTVKAQWEANTYTVKYDANRPVNASSFVTNMPKNSTCVYDSDLYLGTAPALKGWIFKGWYKDIEGNEKIGDANKKLSKPNLAESGEVTLYAKWVPEIYSVTYNANGGVGEMTLSEHLYDVTDTLETNDFKKEGYAFYGWSTNKDAKSPQYYDGDKIKNLATSGNVELYAIWLQVYDYKEYCSRSKRINKGKTSLDSFDLSLDKNALHELGYTSIKLEIELHAKETCWIVYNGAGVNIKSNGVNIGYLNYGTFYNTSIFGDGWASKTLQTVIPLESFENDCDFDLEWFAYNDIGTDDDGWYLGDVKVKITAIKQ